MLQMVDTGSAPLVAKSIRLVLLANAPPETYNQKKRRRKALVRAIRTGKPLTHIILSDAVTFFFR